MTQYLIAGGTSGIGATLARALSGGDAQVHVLSRNEPAEPLTGVHYHACDVTADTPELPELEGPLDGLAYLPGSLTLKPFHLLRPEAFRRDYEVNVLGAVRTLQHYLPRLKEAPQAAVVLVSTVAVETGMPYHASVASAKAAVEGLARSLAAELAPRVRVNVVAPSLTDTPLAGSLLNQDAKRERAAERHPLGRVGAPEDIAAAIRFLLGPESTWITGQVLHVDGGLSRLRLL